MEMPSPKSSLPLTLFIRLPRHVFSRAPASLNLVRSIFSASIVMSQAVEPSLIDYARFYGLAVNHLEVDPLVDLPVLKDVHIELEDGPQIFKIDSTNGKAPEERLIIGRGEVLLLGSLNAASDHTLSFEGIELDPHRFRNMKLELPMLRTDHEANMQDFARPLLPDLAHEHLPLENVDDEADEGLSWPSECASLPDVYYAECKAEKLDVSLDILHHVRNVLYYDRVAVEDLSFELEELPRRKVKAIPSRLSRSTTLRILLETLC